MDYTNNDKVRTFVDENLTALRDGNPNAYLKATGEQLGLSDGDERITYFLAGRFDQVRNYAVAAAIKRFSSQWADLQANYNMALIEDIATFAPNGNHLQDVFDDLFDKFDDGADDEGPKYEYFTSPEFATEMQQVANEYCIGNWIGLELYDALYLSPQMHKARVFFEARDSLKSNFDRTDEEAMRRYEAIPKPVVNPNSGDRE